MDRRDVNVVVPVEISTGVSAVSAFPCAFLPTPHMHRVIDMFTDYGRTTKALFSSY